MDLSVRITHFTKVQFFILLQGFANNGFNYQSKVINNNPNTFWVLDFANN